MKIRILAAWKRAVLVLACASSIVALADTTRAAENVEQQAGITSKIAEPMLYARSSYSWPFSSGPVYGTGAISGESFASAAVLRTAVGTFDLTRGVPELPAELKVANRLSKSSSQYFVMQVRTEAFADGTFDELKSNLIAQGGSIVAEIPVAAFIVRMTLGAHAVVSSSPSILALQPYQPAIVTLSARTSAVDACPSGVLQFQFWNDNNGNGVVGDAGDILLRDWTDNSTFVDGPLLTTRYGVKARCSTDPNCDGATNSITLAVPVTCPGGGVFAQTITIAKVPGQPGGEPHPSVTVNWPIPESVDALRGSLSGSPVAPATQVLKRTPVAFSSFEDTVNLCLATNSGLTNSLADNLALDPVPCP